MNPAALEFIRRLTENLQTCAGQPVIDADTHITNTAALSGPLLERFEYSEDYYHGRPISTEDLLREMRMAEVDMAVTWQNPAATQYTEDRGCNFESLLAANRYVRDSAWQHPNRFIPGGWTDPKACGVDGAVRIAETCVREFGFLFVKMNPAQNRYPIDSSEVVEALDAIVSLGAIPVFHFGADTPFTPAEGFERLAARHPDHPIVGIHMGGGGAGYVEAEELYQNARRLGLEHPNVKYVFSAKRDTHVESDLIAYQLAGPPFCHNLCCGSDAPYGRLTWNFGGYRAMFASLIDGSEHTDARVRANPGLFTQEDAARYMGGNFERLVLEGYRRLLEVQEVNPGVCS